MKIYTIKENTSCIINTDEITSTYYEMKFSEEEFIKEEDGRLFFEFGITRHEDISFDKKHVKVEEWNG